MKKVIFLSAFSFLSFATFAQHEGHAHTVAPAAAATTATAVKAVETATPVDALAVSAAEFDFGKIPQGKPVTTEFTVTNTSKTAFKLDNVQASCGCTTPVWDRDQMIEPGKSAKITVGYNAASVAPFTKPVTITYNGNQTKVFTIKGEVFATPAVSAPANQGVNDLKN
ncbi:MAG: DUF1573 domain-containing protein [Chitinophagaceae bacterium]|nr:MAG: DUF1573 domain-containing protein [Chitinophagaceae bacterium]